MHKLTAIGIGVIAGTALAVAPARADDDDAKKAAIAAAVAAIGIAAIAHHKHNHKDDDHRSDSRYEENFERGYNDGLYAAHYNTRNNTEAYREGYDAGRYDREHRVGHYHEDEGHGDRHGAPSLARRGCVGEASARWGVNPRDIHPVKSRQIGGDDYMVEVAAGYRHGKCEVSGDGRVFLLEDGRI